MDIKTELLSLTSALSFIMSGDVMQGHSFFYHWYVWLPLGILGFYTMDLYGKLKFGKK